MHMCPWDIMLVNHRLVGAPRCAIMITWHSFTGSYPHSYPHGVPEPVPSAIMEVEHQGHHSHKVAVLWRCCDANQMNCMQLHTVSRFIDHVLHHTQHNRVLQVLHVWLQKGSQMQFQS